MFVATITSLLSPPTYLLLHLKALRCGNCSLTFPSRVCLPQKLILIYLYFFLLEGNHTQCSMGIHISIHTRPPLYPNFHYGQHYEPLLTPRVQRWWGGISSGLK